MENSEWSGWYCYGHDSAPHNMQISLSINGSSVVGLGQDDLGRFQIVGSRIGENLNFTKTYPGSHTVDYSGVMDEGGQRLWGTWNIFLTQGGFFLRLKNGEKLSNKIDNISERPIEEKWLVGPKLLHPAGKP